MNIPQTPLHDFKGGRHIHSDGARSWDGKKLRRLMLRVTQRLLKRMRAHLSVQIKLQVRPNTGNGIECAGYLHVSGDELTCRVRYR